MAERVRRGALKQVALALLLLGLVAPVGAGQDNRAPDLGEWDEVQVEAGNKVAFQAWAEGVQIYRWNGAKWDFVRPEAVLYADGGNGIVAIHYGGPTWESPGGSIVIGEVIDRCTPDPDAMLRSSAEATGERFGGKPAVAFELFSR